MQAQWRMIGYRHLMTESTAFFLHICFTYQCPCWASSFIHTDKTEAAQCHFVASLQAADQQKNQVGDSRVIVMMFMCTIDQRVALALWLHPMTVRRCIYLCIFHNNVRQRCIKFGTILLEDCHAKSVLSGLLLPLLTFRYHQNLKTRYLLSIKINLHIFMNLNSFLIRELISFLFHFLFLICFLILLLKLSVLYSSHQLMESWLCSLVCV